MSKASASWRAKRAEIIERCGGQCEYCGDEPERLNVHHRYYENGRKPWEYDAKTLEGLCPRCHGIADDERRIVVRATGLLGSGDRMQATGYMEGLAALEAFGGPDEVEWIRVRTYEHARGMGDVFGIEAEDVFNLTSPHGYVSVSGLVEKSPLRRINHRRGFGQ